MPLSPSTRLGPYEIVAPLGAGGMGEVYRARDTRLKRDIAIKVLPNDVAASAERLARFEREATTVAGLSHPNIVVLHSIEEVNGTRFLTMELVEGQSLTALVTPGGLPLARVLDLAVPIADALVAAHEQGVVHRDLKPANVMLTRNGRVKVLDFGLAKPAPSETDLDATLAATLVAPISTDGQLVGTAPYMAPEQVRGEPVDSRTDLFSFGVLVYELAAGKRPFAGPTFADLSSAILRDKPPALTKVRADLPAELERILERCLEKQPRERFQSALDLANELRGLKRLLERGEAPSPRPPAENVASIAVLPFVNRSASADDEYFSDGLADELLNLLAKIRGLRVAARSSAFSFKGRAATVAEVGGALNVATVLEGSVRKAGQRVRISVQLVKVSDGYHLWSETYDRTLDDIFAVQDDIAQSVVKELRTTLLGQEADSNASGEAKAEVAKAAKGRASDAEAHRLYLLALHLMDGLSEDQTARAIEYLKQAVARDPGYALAWTQLSYAYSRQAGFLWAPPEATWKLAWEACDRALALEPELPEAHLQVVWMQIGIGWDWKAARAAMARARELAPGSTAILREDGALTRILGPQEESVALFQKLVEQDPLSARSHQELGISLFDAQRHAEAEISFRRAIELAPKRILAHTFLAFVMLTQGKGEEAVAEAMLESEEPFRLYALAIVHHAIGQQAESDRALQELIAKNADDCAFQIADACGERGEADAAFEWLDRAYELRDPGCVAASVRFHSLRHDPRWLKFMQKMGLAE